MNKDLKIPNVFARKRKKLLNNESKEFIKEFITEEIESMSNEWSGVDSLSFHEEYYNKGLKLTINKINEKINIQNGKLPIENKKGLINFISFLNSLNKCSTKELSFNLLSENEFYLEDQFNNLNKMNEHYYYNSKQDFIICYHNKKYFIF